MSSTKSDRSMSPSTLSEEGRRELIARQHRALYGNESPGFLSQGAFSDDGNTPRDPTAGIPPSAAGGIDPFNVGQSSGQTRSAENNAQSSSGVHQDQVRAERSSSPASGSAPTAFGTFEAATKQSSNTSTSPTGGESPSRQVAKSTTAPIGSGMGPIGSRSTTQQAPNPTLSKRSTTPLPSPLNYGFVSAEQTNNNDRSGSASSNPNAQKETNNGSGMGAWGTGSGVWGSTKIGATSVWG